MTQDKLEAIVARCTAATPGPWVVSGYANHLVRANDSDAGLICEIKSGRGDFAPVRGQAKANIDFIAHARMDIELLLRENAELLAALGKGRDDT